MKRPTKPKRPRVARTITEPSPSSLISFSESPPDGDDHFVRVVFDDRPDWPAPRIRRAPGQPRRWGFYPSHATAGDEVPDDVDYRFNTVEAATIGALQYLEPYWNDDSSLVIHNGVRVPDMPSNAVVTGSPGYRAQIDAGLYDLDQEELEAKSALTLRRSDEQARQATTHYDIPVGQQVHAFCLLYDKLPRENHPKLHDYLDRMMPRVAKRKRQRHLRTFLIVSSEDWPFILRSTEVAITGMEFILKAARIYAGQTQPPGKKRTPLKERYIAVPGAVIRGDLVEAQELVARYDREDAGGADDDEQERATG